MRNPSGTRTSLTDRLLEIVFDSSLAGGPLSGGYVEGVSFSGNERNNLFMSLAAERFESETTRGIRYVEARNTAMDAALIPQINALLAVGLVSLPGMMTGQILSGVEPLVAVKYQIVVMCMIFSSAGLGAAGYLVGMRPRN